MQQTLKALDYMH